MILVVLILCNNMFVFATESEGVDYEEEGYGENVTDETSESGFRSYDFSKQYTDYKYSVFSEDVEFTRSYMEPYVLIDGTIAYRDTGFTYTETVTYYTYEINDINKLEDRVNLFFNNNSLIY